MRDTTNKPDKTTAKDLDLTAIAGIKKYLTGVKKITLAGTDYSPATLMAALQAEVDAIAAADAVKAQWKQQVADTRTVRVSTRALRALLRKYLLTTYGAKALQMLGDFGMNVPKNMGPKSAEAKANAQKKALATRAAKKKALESAASAPLPVTNGVAAVSGTQAHS